MPKLICGAALCLLLVVGCSSSDEIILTPSEAALLIDNVEAGLEAQQQLAAWAFEVGRGDATIGGYTYDPPSAANNWTGTLTVTGGNFPFGDGDLTMTFTAEGDTGFVDPYVDDLTDDSQVTVDALVNFVGTSKDGKPLDISADFVAITDQNNPDSVLTTINGLFNVDHDGYVADMNAIDVQVALDVAQEQITEIYGNVDANVDIPNLEWDGNFDVTGNGTQVDIAIDILGTVIDAYTLNLADLF